MAFSRALHATRTTRQLYACRTRTEPSKFISYASKRRSNAVGRATSTTFRFLLAPWKLPFHGDRRGSLVAEPTALPLTTIAWSRPTMAKRYSTRRIQLKDISCCAGCAFVRTAVKCAIASASKWAAWNSPILRQKQNTA
jgi:hypothetical protein